MRRHLRTLLVQGAKSVVLTDKPYVINPIGQRVQRLRLRSGWQNAVAALTNKNARSL